MGILLLITGVFIIMGGLGVIVVGLVGFALTSMFVLGSMAVGKIFFRL